MDAQQRYERMQSLIAEVWHPLFSCECPRLVPFGSNVYGLSSETSDWDYALLITEDIALHAKVFRGRFRRHICDRGLVVWSQTVDQFELHPEVEV